MGSESWLGQSKDYEIGICCSSAKHTASMSKSKDWLAESQDDVSEWGNMWIVVLVSYHDKNPIE